MVSLGLVWGMMQLLLPREALPDRVLREENAWGFGQILAMLLLVLHLLAMAEQTMVCSLQRMGTSSNHLGNVLENKD